MAAAAAPHEVRPPPVDFQPPCISGQMREYQVEGLRWMVNQYDEGINAILAGGKNHLPRN